MSLQNRRRNNEEKITKVNYGDDFSFFKDISEITGVKGMVAHLREVGRDGSEGLLPEYELLGIGILHRLDEKKRIVYIEYKNISDFDKKTHDKIYKVMRPYKSTLLL